MRQAVIYSTGSYLPEKVVLNEDLTQFPPESIPRIAQKTGVLARRVAQEGQCTSDLGIKAALNCLEKVNFPPDQLDGIIVSTSSPDRVHPPTASRLQAGIGAPQTFSFDFNAVCSGSAYGICMAHSLIKSGLYENILFVAAEMYSKSLHPNDFSTLPYFGDGSGAILFRAGNSGRGVIDSCLRCDGHKWDTVGVFGLGTMMPYDKMTNPRYATLIMNGRAVYEFAMQRGPEIIREVVQKAGVSFDDIDHFVCHQANINILKGISAELNVPFEKFFVNLTHYGNTASASVIIALDEAISQGVVKEGDLVLTAAFGGGLSYGANLIRI